jgi:hypothetical protein
MTIWRTQSFTHAVVAEGCDDAKLREMSPDGVDHRRLKGDGKLSLVASAPTNLRNSVEETLCSN